MLGRGATYVIPVVAVVVTALVLLGPGAGRSAIGVRVRGLPREGSTALALRIETVRRASTVDDAVAVTGLSVEGTAAGAALGPWQGSTGSDGIAEVSLPTGQPLRGPVSLRVTRGEAVLAEGPITIPPAAHVAAGPAVVGGVTTGDLSIQVEVLQGTLAAPFEGSLRLRLVGSGREPLRQPGVVLEVSMTGGELTAGQERVETDRSGAATLQVKPLAHHVELTVTARDPAGRTGRWVGVLPVLPGAMRLEPLGATELSVISPAPRERAYVSLLSDHGRVAGAVVPLVRDPAGFHAGRFAAELPPAPAQLHAVVSGDPYEQGVGTVAWPIRPAEGAPAVQPITLLLDGLPAAELREMARANRARQLGLLVIGAAALLEVLLLVRVSRASQRRLEEHLNQASGEAAEMPPGHGDSSTREESESAPLSRRDRAKLIAATREGLGLRVAILAALVILGFALFAAVMQFR